MYAVNGKSRSDKSILLNLIQNYFRNYSRNIEIDNIDY